MRTKHSDFYALIESYFSKGSVELIDKAIALAESKLEGMTRYDGTPLMMHSINTARIVISEIGLGRNSTISTIMHDVVRMGLESAERVGALFGEQCTPILKGLCNISDVKTKISEEQADNFRDLIVSYSTDPRVILIKLADRLEVMRRLDMFPPEKRVKKSWESLNLYAQIAHKLGLYTIKSEFEDISLSYLEPEEYRSISKKLRETASERTLFISKFLEPIEAKLKHTEIKYAIKSREKSIFSIWSKMRRMGIPFEEVYDIFALRIIIDCAPEQEKQQCWGVYSVVTDFYTPNPTRMRDWISIPKSNGYESLHATVVTQDGNWVEIQIRSERMDAVAERGIAAHWRYKGVHQGGISSEQWLSKVRELMEADAQTMGAKFDYQSISEIFVFTPNGDLRKLPEGATVLDFAFDIHTNLGVTCTGARVNQRNVQIKEVLKSGDIVEILTSKGQKPKQDWLNVVVTNKARSRIKAYLREEQAKVSSLGREEFERRLKNWKLNIALDDAVGVMCKYYKLKTGTELYGQIAEHKLDLSNIKELLVRHIDGEAITQPKERKVVTAKSEESYSEEALIIDDSIRNLDYKLGKCCNPIFGDEVFGFVTISAGITIHRQNCPNASRLKEMYPYRVMPAKWRDTHVKGAFQVSIKVLADNTTGIVNRITEVLSQELKINIRSMNLSPNNKGEISGLINIEVKGLQTADAAIYSIGKIKGVQRAYRVHN